MSLGAVTGRRYIKTRVRGYADWSPKTETLEIIERVKDIIAEYAQPLTIRHLDNSGTRCLSYALRKRPD